MKANNVLWVDFVRVVATFSVVLLHSAAPLLYKYNELSIGDWWMGNLYDSIVRMCVPLFFLISGYLLLDKKETASDFFMKRTSRVIFPLLIWSMLYILWKHYIEGIDSITLLSFFSLAMTPAYYHLWFMYAIIGIYLYVPILRIFVQNSTTELLCYFVALWFLSVSIIPFIEKITHIDSKVDLKMISGYVGYLVLGNLLGKAQLTKRYLFISFIIFILAVATTSIGTYIMTVRNNGAFFGYLYSYLSPNVIFMSAAAFVFFKYTAENIRAFEYGPVKKIIGALSSASLGIYFIHTMVLYILSNGYLGFKLNSFTYKALYAVPATAMITFTVSFAAIWMVRKIPVIRKIAP